MDRERFNREITAILRTAKQHTRNSRAYLAASYAQIDRVKKAKAEVEEIRHLDPQASVAGMSDIEYYIEPADKEHFEAGLRKAALPEGS